LTYQTLITHSGRFHADDLFAFSILHTLFPQATLERRRDAMPAPHALLFDTGRTYDPALGVFDHHQTPRPERDNKVPYSSFGLIWKHFGHAWLEHHALNALAWQRLDVGFIQAIDLMDNGLPATPTQTGPHPLSITRLLSTLNPPFDASDEADTRFLHASGIAGALFLGLAQSIDSDIRSELVIKEALATRVDPRWMELPSGMPWLNGLRKYKGGDVLYALFPSESGWTISAIHQGNAERDLRKPFPEAWAGQTEEALQHITGVPDAVFCHQGRFLCVAKSKAGALALLDLALKA
jgi:uncharacterized UPF0160 family protein